MLRTQDNLSGDQKMKIITKHIFLGVILTAFVVSGCAAWLQNFGKLKRIPEGPNQMTIQKLIDNWNDYDVYYSDQYSGMSARSPLGIMFDPKDNDTRLTGDLWKKVSDQKTLIEMTRWIYPTTQYEPWLNEILGPDGRLYGYLYYSFGFATLKQTGENEMYVFNLNAPIEETDGRRHGD